MLAVAVARVEAGVFGGVPAFQDHGQRLRIAACTFQAAGVVARYHRNIFAKRAGDLDCAHSCMQQHRKLLHA